MNPDAAAPELLPMDEIEKWMEDALHAKNGPAFVRAVSMALRHPEGAAFKDAGGPVHWLIGTGSPALMASYINNGGKNLVRVRNPLGNTPLHVVAAVCPPGAAAMVDLLVGAGASVHMNNHWGQSPLHLAGGQGHHAMHANPAATAEDRQALVAALLSAGADPDAPDGLKVPARALINPDWLPARASSEQEVGSLETGSSPTLVVEAGAFSDGGPSAPGGTLLSQDGGSGPESDLSSDAGISREAVLERPEPTSMPIETDRSSVWDYRGEECPIRPAAAFASVPLPEALPAPVSDEDADSARGSVDEGLVLPVRFRLRR